MLFNPSTKDSREFIFSVYDKYSNNQILTPIEHVMLNIIMDHKEYHYVFSNKDKYMDLEYLSDGNTVNPFLHIMLHLAIEEQLSINQPLGIVDKFDNLKLKFNSIHEVKHQMMNGLIEMIYHSSQYKTPISPEIYLNFLDDLIMK